MTTNRYLKISSINLFETTLRDAPPATLQSLLSAIKTDRSKKAQLQRKLIEAEVDRRKCVDMIVPIISSIASSL